MEHTPQPLAEPLVAALQLEETWQYYISSGNTDSFVRAFPLTAQVYQMVMSLRPEPVSNGYPDRGEVVAALDTLALSETERLALTVELDRALEVAHFNHLSRITEESDPAVREALMLSRE